MAVAGPSRRGHTGSAYGRQNGLLGLSAVSVARWQYRDRPTHIHYVSSRAYGSCFELTKDLRVCRLDRTCDL